MRAKYADKQVPKRLGITIYKNSRVPSPRNPAVDKTNLTNRHEKKFLMSDTKIMIFNQNKNFLLNF